ncbi:hypothetical protein LS72_005055 [Helicobacter apodemus]|uniref:Uncharacterized protein n=1 Tax=Helicobacter apodemus TaxID=135569 RepID=A0A4U8UIQ4_9HELI|nr:hypothetical protein [Helicobacter apodemus]TLE15929.1 hypothetical protein LS72_005055 [Helicobacter apodemus]
MRRKESYYLQLQEDFHNFLKTLENQELFLLKSVVCTKAFKEYLKQKETNERIPSLLKYYGIN